MEPDVPKRNLKRLFFGKESVQWMDQESRKLLGLMGPSYASLAATGGTVVRDIFGTFDQLQWDTLVSQFLHTTRKQP